MVSGIAAVAANPYVKMQMYTAPSNFTSITQVDGLYISLYHIVGFLEVYKFREFHGC